MMQRGRKTVHEGWKDGAERVQGGCRENVGRVQKRYKGNIFHYEPKLFLSAANL